jgi:hypothetical protein
MSLPARLRRLEQAQPASDGRDHRAIVAACLGLDWPADFPPGPPATFTTRAPVAEMQARIRRKLLRVLDQESAE